MKKKKTNFLCQNCGYVSLKWLGKCPDCGSWSSFVEEVIKDDNRRTMSSGNGINKPVSIVDLKIDKEDRFGTGIGELDQVLGGGIVRGSMVLIGGDPGIGKSTLLLQSANMLSCRKNKVLYVSGEESLKQTKLRAERLGANSESLLIMSENNIEIIIKSVEEINPDVLVVDSIQTVFDPEISSAPGSVSQIREITSSLMKIAKGKNIATFIIGHVTKSGNIAGPKVLEHMVDTVLYFEGENHNVYRILRAVKNRFGSTNELGIFEMRSAGLFGVDNPSEVFLSDSVQVEPGSIIIPTIEGSRTVLVEIQSLVTTSNFGNPRRMANGLDQNRVIMLMAVLEKRFGYHVQDCDAYVNVVGGLKITEPAIDLGVIASIASSFKNKSVNKDVILFGEVGLTGEVRRVNSVDRRINEAKRMGFKKCIIPKENLIGYENEKEIEVIGVRTIEQAFEEIF
ncbi:MAG: DNA repair protein RadA [Firmicutes bacterium]|nr:DNA repair protein RadA [Bacillota bacterium]